MAEFLDKYRIQWRSVEFDQLRTKDLYQILQLRCNVFVVESQVVRQELDDIDLICCHVIGELDDVIIATSRFFGPLNGINQINLSSVCVSSEFRNLGIGRKLVEISLEESTRKFPGHLPIVINTPWSLEPFFKSLGFAHNNTQDERNDGISIRMIHEGHETRVDVNSITEFPPLAPPLPSWRFKIGTLVSCRVGTNPVTGWAPGRVVALNYTESSWSPGVYVPYQICLNDGSFIFAPLDNDDVIRLRKVQEMPSASVSAPYSESSRCNKAPIGEDIITTISSETTLRRENSYSDLCPEDRDFRRWQDTQDHSGL